MQDLKRLALMAASCVVFFFLAACGEAELDDNDNNETGSTQQRTTCEAACDNIYNTCGLYLVHPNGAGLAHRGCVQSCDGGEFRQQEECVAEAECLEDPLDMIGECIPGGYQTPYCDHLGPWPLEWETMEEEVLELVNLRRSEGANCGGQQYPPVGPVTMNDDLRCASRLHSVDMHERGFFDHDDPDGVSPFDRIDAAGYSGGGPQGENIAQGYQSAESVMNGWMTSPGHCANIMTAGFKELGVGMSQYYWTQKFGGGN